MKAIEIVCSSFEWWGDRWNSAMPYSIDACTIPDGHQLPNAPVSVYVLTPDALEARNCCACWLRSWRGSPSY